MRAKLTAAILAMALAITAQTAFAQKTVTLAAQSGTINAGTAGSATFAVATSGIANGQAGTVTWGINETFESGSGTTLVGWTFVNGTQTNKWQVGTAAAKDGTKSVYVSNDNGAANAYTITSSSTVHFYRDVVIASTAANPAKLSFDWRCQGENTHDDLRVYVVETSVTPAAGTSLTTANSTLLATLSMGGAAAWNHADISLPAMSGAKRIVFTWRNDGSVGSQPPAAIDNIVATGIFSSTAVSSTAPAGISASATNVSGDEATITMSASSAATVGTYPFAVIIDGTASNAATLTIRGVASISAQSGRIFTGMTGSAAFAVATAGIADGQAGSVTWYTTSAGTTTATAPTGISASVTNVAGNAATVAISATAAATAGTRYFKVTIDGRASPMATLTVESMPTTFYIITGSGTSFSASKASAGGTAIANGSNAAIQSVINAIKADAAGAASTILFGDGTNTLDIDTNYISFNGGGTPSWGLITLTGKITSALNSSSYGTIYLSNGVSIASMADIANTGSYGNAVLIYYSTVNISGGTVSATTGDAVRNTSTGTVNISGGTVSATDGGYAVHNYVDGTVNISGGTVSATTGYAVRNNSTGAVNISGGTVSATTGNAVRNNSTGKITVSGTAKVTSASGSTIYLIGSDTATDTRLEITGGTVENTAGDRAICNESTGGILLSGDPAITGAIMKASTGILSVDGGFNPASGKTYTLGFSNFSGTAVAGGASHIANFTLASSSLDGVNFSLSAIGSNLVVAATNGYAVSASGTTYTITKGTGTYATIQSAIDNIRTQANGAACIIQFGDGTNVLDIGGGGSTIITFDGGTSGTDWGLITFTGKLTSSSTSTSGIIRLSNGASIDSRAELTATSGDFIYNNSRGTVNISGGTVSATTGNAVRNNSTGAVNISGGTVSATTGNAVYNSPTGTVNISGGTVSATTGRAVYNGSIGAVTGTVNISGGTVSATTGYAVYNGSGGLLLSGDPAIIGTIMKAGTGILSVDGSFAPSGGKTYTLGFTNFSGVAVAGGASHIAKFALASSSLDGVNYALAASGSDIVLAIANGYAVSASGTTYTITKGTGTYATIQSAIDNIKTQANGAACTIRFGNGTDVLDIGDSYINFAGGTSWGLITLTGKITSAFDNSSYGTIDLYGVSIASMADIANTASSGNAVYNYGSTVNISGGTVSATSGTAVNNNSTGTVNISGGTVSATTSAAVSNYSTGAVSISGGTVSATSGYAVYNNSTGTVNISGGTVSATTGYAVYNDNTGKITVSGMAKVTSASTSTIHLTSRGTAETAERLEITGGTVENTVANANAVYNYSTGGILLSGDPAITGAIMKAGTGILSVDGSFAPSGGKTYTLGFTDYSGVAVAGGASHIAKFALASSSLGGVNFGLSASGSDIVLAIANGYAVEKDGSTYTIITKGSGTIVKIQDAIDNIKTQANGAACTIQFGNGAEVLDIGTSYIDFSGGGTPAWGLITLEGKITSAYSNSSGTIYLSNGVSIASMADIANTASGNAVLNSGTVNISGGTVSAKTGYAVRNNSTGIITIAGGFLFAYGTEAADVIYGDYAAPSGDAVIAAWNKKAGNTEYASLTKDDIFSSPATAVWLNKDGKVGISANNGENTGFVAIEGVTVDGDTPIRSPQIASGNIRVQATANAIVLENLPKNAKVEVYSLQGKRIHFSNSGNSQILRIQVQTKGLYVVKIGNQTMRVAVR